MSGSGTGRSDEKVKVMAKFAKELIRSLTQAAKRARNGNVKGVRVTAVELPDVKAIRRSLPPLPAGRGKKD